MLDQRDQEGATGPTTAPQGADSNSEPKMRRDAQGQEPKEQDDQAEADETQDEAPKAKRPSLLRRHPFWILLAVLVVVALAVAGYFYWLIYSHPFETTDDAFVDSRQFAVAPKVSGYITEVTTTDNQHVNAGDVLFRVDPRDYEVALHQAEAQVSAATASIQSADAQIAAQLAQIEEAKSQVAQAQASLDFAKSQAARAQELAKTGTGTVQSAQQQTSNLEEQQANYVSAQAAVRAADKQIGSLEAQKSSSVANRREAQAQLEKAKLDLTHTILSASQSGRMVMLTGAKGQYIEAGQSVAMFVPDEIWVTANFKETQITDMRPGQPADLKIDAYPDHKITGRVDSVQPGSGTAFSLLPAENATGNYVKVVQRVPVKIVVDAWPQDVSIGPGMSVVPTVTVRPRT